MHGSCNRADAGMTEINKITCCLIACREIINRYRVKTDITDGPPKQYRRYATALGITLSNLRSVADRNEHQTFAMEHMDAPKNAFLGVRLFIAVENDE
jgi:hypothetical protein